MIIRICRGSHFLGEQGPKASTIGVVHRNILSPIGDVVRRVFGHSTSHTRHEPRVAVTAFVFSGNGILGSEAVIRLDGMLDIVAARQGFDSQNVVEVQAFVARDSSWRSKKRMEKALLGVDSPNGKPTDRLKKHRNN